MKKKILFTIIAVCTMLLAFGMINASAETYGNLTYSVSNNKVTITDCRQSAITVDIPNEIEGCPVTSIGREAFQDCSSLTSITIPDSVTYINYKAFAGCSDLTSIIIPDSVTRIYSYAFSGCFNLTSITIPDSVTYIGSYAFTWCTSLTSITIPDSITSIDKGTFDACFSLTSVTIPDSITSIGDYAFDGCSKLISITIPDSITLIGKDAFDGCSRLNKVNITDIGAWCSIEFNSAPSNPLYYADSLYLNGTLVTKLDIPDGVTSIGDYVFYNCSSLASITIPDGVTSIGYSAFYDCYSLTSITIPDSITSIGGYAFYNCSSLANITIPDGVASIDWNTFGGCSNLTSIIIPDSVTSIRGYAFYNCSNLKLVTIPDSVNSIGGNAFYNCASLISITIPYGVMSIANATFYECTSLTNITISDSLTLVGEDAFYNCSNIKNVYYTGTEEEWNALTISSGNDILLNARKTFDYINFTISYNLNGGENGPWTQIKEIGEAVAISNIKPTREHFKFLGWSTTDSGKVEYYSGETYTKDESLTLYAVWEAVPYTTLTITHRTNFDLIDIELFDLNVGCTVILAVYNTDNRLVNIQSNTYKGEMVSFVESNDYDTAKVMVWDSFTTLKPLCDVTEVKIENE